MFGVTKIILTSKYPLKVFIVILRSYNKVYKNMIHLPKFKNIDKKRILLPAFLIALVYIPIIIIVIFINRSKKEVTTKVQNLDTSVFEISKSQENFKENFSEDLFNDHLSIMQKNILEDKLTLLEEQFEELSNTEEGATLANVLAIYELYESFEKKVDRNSKAKLDTEENSKKLDEWGKKLIDKEFEDLENEITEQNDKLDQAYDEYLATLPPPPPPASNGYTGMSVTTEKGTHYVYLIKVPLGSVRIKTVAAISSDCSNECPTKSLADYVNENGGFAGMNGSYACPPDYSSCAGKVNSFDFALYDSNDKKWLNKDALSWFKTGMITFKGSSFSFYKKTSEYDGGSVDAGVSNFPSLLKNGEVVTGDGDITSYQKVKALRGAIGVGDGNLYLAHITNATVEDAAYVMKALGVQHALNLDGGGTAAMYINGGYVVGPGRSLANAIVLIR